MVTIPMLQDQVQLRKAPTQLPLELVLLQQANLHCPQEGKIEL